MKKFLLSALLLAGLLTGCASETDVSPNNKSITQVIDVRTAEEYASGHVANSVNMDVESTSFLGQISTLDRAGVYLVYCHSGRRSAIAAKTLSDAGFTVIDGGGLDSMLNTGWELGQ